MTKTHQTTTEPDAPGPEDVGSLGNGKCPIWSIETANPDEPVFHYADFYDRAFVGDDEALIEKRRELLFLQLRGYQRFLHFGPEPSLEMETWTSLQRTIHYASDQAERYLGYHEPEEIVDLIIKDMVEEQRNLPRGVAEWVVERVSESIEATSGSDCDEC